jgi:hypothetical protein
MGLSVGVPFSMFWGISQLDHNENVDVGSVADPGMSTETQDLARVGERLDGFSTLLCIEMWKRNIQECGRKRLGRE